MNEGLWVELPDKEATEDKPATTMWHIILETRVERSGYVVETYCGITAPWNNTYVDAVADGHDACIAAQAKAAKKAQADAEKAAEEEAEPPKVAAKSK